MVSKQKHYKDQLIKCNHCKVLFSNKLIQLHKEECHLKKLQQFSHSYISNEFIKGKVVYVEANSSLVTLKTIFMNPSLMNLVGLKLASQVIINYEENDIVVLQSWPKSDLSFTNVAFSEKAKSEFPSLKVGAFVYIRPLKNFSSATKLVLSCENSYISKTKQFYKYLHSELCNNIYYIGYLITFQYFGRKYNLTISNIESEDKYCNDFHKMQIIDSLESTSDFIILSETFSSDNNDLLLNCSHEDFSDELPVTASTPFFNIENPYRSKQLTDKFFLITDDTEIVIYPHSSSEISNTSKNQALINASGCDSVVDQLTEISEIVIHKRDEAIKFGLIPPRGILLFGPGGCGKTFLANCFSKEFKTTIWFGKSNISLEAELVNAFESAEKSAPSIILIDDIDILCSSKEECSTRFIQTLTSLIDCLENDAQILLFATTKYIEKIPMSLRRPGRFDKEIEISVPNSQQRFQLLNHLLSRSPHELTSCEIQAIARDTHGYVASDLIALINEGVLIAWRNFQTNKECKLSEKYMRQALQYIRPSALKEVIIDVPRVKWSDIGGQSEVKLRLQQSVVWPIMNPKAFEKLGLSPPRGVLMYGPPGCSKTMIARALATETGLNFISIKGPELFSKWVGESERAVREVFRKARQSSPSIIFFDEIDALAVSRSGSSSSAKNSVHESVLAQLLTEMDGINPLSEVTVVAATNRPDLLDKALLRPGRFDRLIYLPLPDCQTRFEIFNIIFKRMPVSSDVSVQELVQSTQNFSGAEVVAVCSEAGIAALEDNINSDEVANKHFKLALDRVTPRIKSSDLRIYEEFINNLN